MLHSPPVTIGFFNGQLLIRTGRYGEELLHSCMPEQLDEFVRGCNLSGMACAVSLPSAHCRVKTVTLARVSTAELRNITQQDYFWQESLGVAQDDFSLFWRVLPNRESDQITLLLSALPRQHQQSYLAPIIHARLRVERQSLACFDLLAATRSSSRHVTAVLGHDACLVAFTAAGISLQSFSYVDANAFQDERSLSALLPELAASVRRISAAEQDSSRHHATSVVVISAAAESFNQQVRVSLPPLLPAQFSTQLVTPAQIIRRYVDTGSTKVVAGQVNPAMLLTAASVVAAARARDRTYPDFNNIPAIRRRQLVRQWLFVMLFGACVLLVFSAYAHWRLLHERNSLETQLLRYDDLSAQHSQLLQTLESLRQEQRYYTASVADVQNVRAAHASYPRLLKLVASSTAADLSVDEAEFYVPSMLRIRGHALNNKIIVHFADSLRRHDLIRHVVIKNLVTETGTSMKSFTLDCELAQFTASD